MTVVHPPDTVKRLDRLYRLSPDGDEQILSDADHCKRDRHLRSERRDYLIIDGHMYYPIAEHGPHDIWRGRDVYAGRSIA